MYRSIPQTPSNKRVFGACLLSFMTLIAPIASVGAATRGATVPLSLRNNKATESAQPSLVEPAAMPAAAPVPAPAPLLAVGPITATKTDSFPDADGDGKAELGEIITYTIGITNTGTDPALGVTFNDNIDANTTFVPGSMHASPIAFDETYEWVGNTVLDTAARSLPSVTANDVAVTDTFTLDTQTNAPTTQGGTVTLAANGHFVYTPQLGDGGPGFSDTFNYTIRNSVDNTLVGTGTVTINMPVRVWYLQAGAAGDGRSNTPSGSPATISTAANLASDILYVYFNASNLNGAFTLDSGQTLTGEGVALVANSITLRPAGPTPTITNTTGDAVTLGGNNLVTGLNISQANNFAIAGNAISGTTNVTGVGITNSASGGGLTLTTQAGTINFTNSPISGTTSGVAVFVSGGTGAINFSNSPISRTTGRLLDIQNKTGGSVLFNGGSTVIGTAITTDAIVLRNHTGVSSLTFSNNVQVTTSNGRGIQADNSSGSFVLIMNAAANTISATNGAALDVEDLAATTALAFTSITSTNSSIVPAHGLRVNNTNGTLNFGNATLNSSANTGALLTSNASTITFADLDIAPDSGVRGLHATGNTGTITSTSGDVVAVNGTAVEIVGTSAAIRTPLNMTLTKVSSASNAANGLLLQNVNGPGASVGFVVVGDGTNTAVGGNATGGTITGTTGADGATAGNGVYLENADEVTLRRMTINGTNQNHGVRGVTSSNITLEYCTVNGTNGTSTAIDEGSVHFSNLTVAAAITSCLIEGGLEENLNVVNTSGTLNRLTITGTTFGLNSSASGNNNILIESQNAGTILNFTLQSSTIKGARADWINISNNSSSTMDAVIGGSTPALGNTFDNLGANAHPTAAAGGNRVVTGSVGPATIDIRNNTMKGSKGEAIRVRSTATGALTGTVDARVRNNTIGVAATANSGSSEGSGIFIFVDGGADADVAITNNSIFQYNNHAIRMDVGDEINPPTVFNATVTGNTANTPGNINTDFNGIQLNHGTVAATDNFTSCVDIGGAGLQNIMTGSGSGAIAPNNAEIRLRQRQSTTVRLPGYGGANNDDAAVVTYLLGRNTATTAAASNTVPTGGGFIGGAACTQPSFAMLAPEPSRQQNQFALLGNGSQFESQIDSTLFALTNALVSKPAADTKATIKPGVSVNNALLLAKASVNGHRGRSTTSISAATSREEVRFAHARSNKRRANPASAGTSFLSPMPPLTPLSIGTLPGNKSVTIKFQVTVNSTGLGLATSVSNQGTVSGTNFSNVLTDDPSVGGTTDPTVTPISRLDVQVTKTDGVTSTTPGSDLTYTLTYTNNDHAANGVVLTETVPVGTTFKAAGSSVWTGCADSAPAGTVCTINLGNLPRNTVAGFTGTRTFVVTVLNPAPAGVNNIVNTGSIAHDGSYEADYIPANNTTTDTDTLTAVPDLNISKTDGVTNTTPGSTLTYTITYSNVGTQNATGVVLTETVPVGTTFTTTGSSAWTGCANGAPAGTICTINVGTLTAGAAASIATFAVVVTNPAAAGLTTIVDTASIADDGANGTDPTLPNTSTDTDTLDAAPDLTISKVADVTDVAPGDTIVYTLTYANAGNQNATGVVITETVPLHTTFSAADSAPTVWSCADNSPAATVCTTSIGALAGGGSGGTVKFAVKVVDPIPPLATQISNTATIADDGGNGADPTPGNNTTGAVITPILVCTPPPANLTNWWTGDDTPRDIAGGKDGTLNGAGYGTGKVLQGFSFDGVDDYVDVDDVDLPIAFTIDAWINPTDLLSERAIVSKDNGVLRSYFFNVTTTGALRALVQSAAGITEYQTGPGVVTAGTFQHVAVTYDGTAGAGAKMLFYVNGGAPIVPTVVGGADNGGAPDNNTLAANIGRSADGTSHFFGVIDELEFFGVALAQADIQSIVTADSGGKCKPPDLTITKTHTPPFNQGSGSNTYTIIVTNQGPGATTGSGLDPVNVLDNLPAGLTATAWSGTGWVCTPIPVGGTAGLASLTCTRSDVLASGASYPSIFLTVTAGVNTASVDNTVTVTGGGEMDTSDNSATDTTILVPVADLSITKTDGLASEVPGTSVSYTIVVTNNGPSTVTGATVADTFPAEITGVTYTSSTTGVATGNTAAGAGNISDTVTMPSGSTITYLVSGTISPSATGSLANTATVTAPGGTTDPDLTNNSATDTDTLNVTADLSITKTDGLASEVPGTSVSYTIVVTNNGPSSVIGATVADTFPAEITGVTYTSAPTGGATGNTAVGAGNISDTVTMPSGSTITYLVSGTISPSATGNLSNTATVAAPGGTTDPDLTNNSATDTDTLTVTADLSITKTDGLASEVPGTSVSYTIVVTNNGPSNVIGATVADTFPAEITGVTFTSVAAGGATGNTAVGAGNINDTVNMPSGSSITYTATGTISPSATVSLANTATVTAPGGTTDPDTTNNSATDTDTLNVTADLSITKTDLQTNEVPGTAVSYTIVVTNNGPSNVTGATVADTFPATITGVTYTSVAAGGATGNTAAGSGNINDTVNMPSGSSVTYTATGTISPSATGSLSNTATVTAPAGVTDAGGNNTATDTDTLTAQADLEIISKTGTPTPTVIAGENITYTINFRNNGPSDAQTVTVTDGVPANTTFVSAAFPAGWSRTDSVPVGGTGNIVFAKATVVSGETATFTMVVKVNSSTPFGSTISNTATTASATNDPTPANNSKTATTTVNTSADLLVVKIDSPDPVVVGDNLTYTITVTNNGSSDAQNLSLSDTLPPNTTFVSFTVPAGWTRTDAVVVGGTGTVTATAPTLAAGASAVFTLVVNVNLSTPHNTVLTNSATATSTTTDPNPVNNTGTATTTVINQADLSIIKDNPESVVAGTNITYTLLFANNGPATANNVTVTDAVPVNTTFVSAAVADGSGWTITTPPVGGTGNVQFSKGTVAAGETAVFTIIVNVNPGTPDGTGITNTAVTATTTVDPDSSNNTASVTTTVFTSLALTVNNNGDAADANVGDQICDTDLGTAGEQCTLRAAIQETNAAITADNISFTLAPNDTITLTSALDDISGDLVITGPASGLTVSGNNLFRVFLVQASKTVRISNLTIANGQSVAGGGIYNSGNLTISNSTFTGNKAVGPAAEGGAIFSDDGTLTILNSTISGNSADGSGGGLLNSGTSTATLVNVTITNNRANADGVAPGSGGGIGQVSSNPITLRNTIVAGNFTGVSPGTAPDDISGTVDPSSNNNLVGTGGSGGLTNGVNNNQVGVADARLAPLANNGGPTQTHALLAGSPALDAGDNTSATNAALTTDQRGPGFGRIADGPDADATATVDIGAFEAQVWVEDIADRSMNEDSTDSFSFNVGGSAAITSVTATSSNAALVPNNAANLNVSGAGSTRTLTINPVANQNGTTIITVTVNSASGSMTDTFVLTVNAVNDPPSFTKGPDQTVAEDSGPQTVPNWATNISAGPANESGQTLTFVVQNNTNPGLFSAGPAISSTGTLTYTPAANANGSATITIALMDNGGGTDTSPSQTFIITVTEVNDPPDAVNDVLSSVAEDSGQRTIPIASLLANDTTGPANESGQTLTFSLVGGSGVGGTVSSDATNVYFTPAADFNGTASFQYMVTDNGTTNGVADPKSDTATVSFTVWEVNDAPIAVNDTLASMAEDSGPRTIPSADLIGNDSPGAANENSVPVFVNVGNAVGGTVTLVNGVVTFTPTADYFGPASFEYTIEDNDTTNGVPDPKTSAPATASFTITEVNDAPTAVNDTLGNVAEDSGQRTIPFADLTGNDSKGPANESGQTLVVKTVSNAVGGTVSIVGGNVLFTPTADYSGPASFDYTVEDNGTTNGAADPKTSGTATVSFNITAQADAPSVTNATTNANTQTTSGLVISRNPADGAEVTHFKITGITGGTLFKNDGTTVINNGDFITFAEGNAGLKFTPGTSNGSFTVQASLSASDAGLQGGTALATIFVNPLAPLGGVIRFSAANYSVAEGAGFTAIAVERTGDASQPVTVDYASSDHSNPADFIPCTSPGAGLASSRCDFSTAIGTLRFAAGETTKTFNVLISQDNYVEGTETLSLTLSNPTAGAVLGVPAAAILEITDDATEPATNPIDNAGDFVRQQYHDMLNREPDGPGLAFWTDNIEKCNDPARRPAGQTVAQCIDKQRESTAIAFFMSPEFQMTGGFTYRLYKGSLTGVPNYDGGSAGRFPTFVEFIRDVSQVSEGIVVNNQISGAVVEANRNRLAAEFVQRPEFVAKYGGLDNTLYVQELFNTTGITPTAAEKQALVDGLGNSTETRASVLRKVVDGTVVISEGNVQFTTTYGQAFYNQEFQRVFVFMEYIGYLRRNPDTAGYVFWLGKLNFYNGDPFQAEMVRSFILSPEYRSRFGQP